MWLLEMHKHGLGTRWRYPANGLGKWRFVFLIIYSDMIFTYFTYSYSSIKFGQCSCLNVVYVYKLTIYIILYTYCIHV